MATRERTRTSGIRRKQRIARRRLRGRFRDSEGVQRSRTFASVDGARTFQNATLADLPHRHRPAVRRRSVKTRPKAGRVAVRSGLDAWGRPRTLHGPRRSTRRAHAKTIPLRDR